MRCKASQGASSEKEDIAYSSLHSLARSGRIAARPRTARSTPAWLAYHVVKRGNHRAQVFHHEGDYDAFVRLRAKAAARFPVRILAFGVLFNHFHLALWPQTDDAIRDFMHWLLTTHATRYLRP